MTFASWKKCDFQIHTCRDPNWQGERPFGLGDAMPSGGTATAADVEQVRNEWAAAFVAKCIAKGLQVVAITDHHETVMIPYVRAAIAEHNRLHPEQQLWLLPGMELTAKGGSQCIILFDHDLGDEWLRQAQGKLGIVFAQNDETSAKGAKVEQLPIGYSKICSELDTVEQLKKRYIVLPNLSQSGTHTVLFDGGHTDFREMSPIGGYFDGGKTFNDLSAKNRTRLSGDDKKWSSREVHPIQTSDCRTADRAALGTNDTWIKLEAPTAEAVRQAFLAHKSRIRTSPPELPSVFVSSVSIQGSSILDDISVSLSPEQNSIIGGRGSGKSSFLEYLALGLGKSCGDLSDRETYSGNKRLTELVTETLKVHGGRIHLIISQDGALFELTRGPETAYQPQVTYADGSRHTISLKDVRTLFPAVVYAQGELAELGKTTASKADLTDLLQFVNPDYKRQDDAMLAELENAKRDVRIAVEKQVEAWTLSAAIRKLQATRDSLADRIAALERTLPALSPDDQKKIDAFEASSAFEGKREQASKQVDQILAELVTLHSTHRDARDIAGGPEPEAGNVRRSYLEFHAAAASALSTLETDLKARKLVFADAEKDWTTKHAEVRKERDAVLEKLSAHKVATQQIIKFKEELAAINSQIADQETKAKTLGDPSSVLTTKIQALRKSADTRAEKTASWAAEIESLSSGKIIAKVIAQGNIDELREALDAVAQKTGSQEATRIREVDSSVASIGVWNLIDRLRTDAIGLLHWRLLGSDIEENQPASSDLFRVLGTSEKTKTAILEQLDATRLSSLATAIPRPQIELSYTDGTQTIAFEKASEGQRAAALLFMLLEQPGGPLIIDQPESDLDNNVITELTDKLHLAKQKRQIVFASHNANIVVNGSSELVGHLHMGQQGMRSFDAIGSIDSKVVREVITRTMEGGEKAFRDRQEKYGF